MHVTVFAYFTDARVARVREESRVEWRVEMSRREDTNNLQYWME